MRVVLVQSVNSNMVITAPAVRMIVPNERARSASVANHHMNVENASTLWRGNLTFHNGPPPTPLASVAHCLSNDTYWLRPAAVDTAPEVSSDTAANVVCCTTEAGASAT